MARRALLPFLAVVLGLVGALAITLSLHRAASAAIAEVLEARLRGAGASAAFFLGASQPTNAALERLTALNDLDAAYVVDKKRKVVADGSDSDVGQKVDLLRIDLDRFDAALQGADSVGRGYDVGDLEVLGGYFPIGAGGERTVLVLEAGRSYRNAKDALAASRDAAIGLSLVTALGLSLIGFGWIRTEGRARRAAEEAARGQTMSEMAAMAAHEIRNPLGVIRWTVELMRERSDAALVDKDKEALEDVLHEVGRLHRLTEDFLDLATDRPIDQGEIDIGSILSDCAKSVEVASPAIRVKVDRDGDLLTEGDGGRIEQVFRNLLSNAAQAQREGEIEVSVRAKDGMIVVTVRDFGPGVPKDVRAKLFDPFFTTRSGGTGLGLAISRRHIERHGGAIRYLEPEHGGGAIFEVRLPRPTKPRLG
jgi:signal transduction histidine kinase